MNNAVSSTVYDPQKRTFIQVQEDKVCPQCGQKIAAEVRQIKNEMNNYVSTSGAVMCLNEDAETVTVKGVTLYKVTGYDRKNNKYTSSFMPGETIPVATPVKPATPVTPPTK